MHRVNHPITGPIPNQNLRHTVASLHKTKTLLIPVFLIITGLVLLMPALFMVLYVVIIRA